jgi:transcriptional regulator with XRE-family HTH domain
MNFRIAFGDIIRELRTERHLTLRQLSKRSHVALGYISEIERGHKDPSSAVMQSLASGLKVPIHQIVIEAGYRMAGWDNEVVSSETSEVLSTVS